MQGKERKHSIDAVALEAGGGEKLAGMRRFIGQRYNIGQPFADDTSRIKPLCPSIPIMGPEM